MTSLFHQLFNEGNAFWLGFIAGALFLWILLKLRIYLPVLVNLLKRAFISLRKSLSKGSEQRYRLSIIRYAQRQHLASPMFSLDEIILQPKVMVPPIQVANDNQTLAIDTINLTIPYIPDWPELGAIYKTPQISIIDALQNEANIALVGNPGSGKTVALAYLASQIAHRSQIAGIAANRLPVFIHAADINFNPERLSETASLKSDTEITDKEVIDLAGNILLPIILTAVAAQVSVINLPRLPRLIKSALDSGRIILLIDGLDELSPDRIQPISLFIKTIVEHFPQAQIVAATSFENLARLPSFGFQVLALSAWGDVEMTEFVGKWSNLWLRIHPVNDQVNLDQSGYIYLASWLNTNYPPCTPLELTLKVWAAYAGDILGSDTPSAIEAYLRRVTINQSKTRDALERFALQMVISMNLDFQPRQSDTIPISYGQDQNSISSVTEDSGSLLPQKVKLSQLPAELTNTGVLLSHPDTRFRFANPVLTGYLAGKALGTYSGLNQILEQPAWSGKSTSLYFYAHFTDAASAAQTLLKNDDFLRKELLRIAHWVRVAPKNQSWRSLILRALVSALQAEKNTLPLAARLITALATSGDPGVVLLFRQMLRSDSPNLRQLAALACGFIKDQGGIEDLEKLLHDSSPDIIRSASLALVAIGNKRALEITAGSLLHGTEMMRRAAAEALANHPVEGFPALKDGCAHTDLRVRHAIIFGLLRVNHPWAIELIERMQTEDKEWLVRNAAIQAMEDISQSGRNIPTSTPDLTETTWLLEFAAKQGMGVAPGKPAYDLVIEALKIGTAEEKLQALSYLSMYGDVESIRFIYSWYFGSSGEIRDAAYQTLWLLSCAGLELPSPQIYGFTH